MKLVKLGGQRLTLSIVCVWASLRRGCSRGSSPVIAYKSSAISSSLSFNEKPKCPAFPRRSRRLHRGKVPLVFSEVGASFGTSVRG
jgi:hypothetical protein